MSQDQQYDTSSLFSFLVNTPESGLRKMLLDPKAFTDTHFGLLLKVIRGCNEIQFSEHFVKTDFPKIKMTPNEIKIKEQFWKDAVGVLKSRGLLSPSDKSNKAA